MQEPPLTLAECLAALPHILAAPKDEGRIDHLCFRPARNQREFPDQLRLTVAAETTAPAKPGEYSGFLSIWRMVTRPGPAASAMALPLMPEKITLTKMSTCASPPRMRPTRIRQKSKIRSLTVPAFMMLAANTKSGTASNT